MTARVRPGVLLTLGAAVLWGTSFPANQLGLRTMEPGAFVAARFVLAALVVLPFAWREIRRSLTHWAPWGLGLINAAAFYLQYVGQVTAPAGAAGLLVNANVVLVALVAWGWLGERPTRTVWAAMGLALAGASLIVYEPGGAGLQAGHLLVFLAGATWSFYMVGTRAAILADQSTTSLALATFVVTGVVLSPFLVLDGVPTDPVSLAMVAYTGIACTVGAFLLWLSGLRSVGATSSAVVLLVEILVAGLLGAWFLGEVFPVRKLVGALAIGAAMVLMSLGRRSETVADVTEAPEPGGEDGAGISATSQHSRQG